MNWSTGSGNVPFGGNSVSFMPPCLTGRQQEYTPDEIYHYESWDVHHNLRPTWENSFKPSGQYVIVHYVCILVGNSYAYTRGVHETYILLVGHLENFLQNWTQAAVRVHFVDEYGEPLRMSAFRHYSDMNGRLTISHVRESHPEIEEMVQLIMDNKGQARADTSLDILDFLFEYRSGSADPDSATS